MGTTTTTASPARFFDKFSDTDVLSGRGGLTNKHPGNKWYRQLCKDLLDLLWVESRHASLEESDAMKVELDRCVMITIMREGRFLKAETSEDPTGNPVCRWREISSKDALSKVQQYTREGLLKRQREAHSFEAKIKKLLLKVVLKGRGVKSRKAVRKIKEWLLKVVLKGRGVKSRKAVHKIKKWLLKRVQQRKAERIDQLERVADRMLHVLPRK